MLTFAKQKVIEDIIITPLKNSREASDKYD